MNESNAVFTICVPTFNRGQKALDLVRYALPRLDAGWMLMIINNCSFNECSEYEEIARLARATPEKLHYRCNKYNEGFNGNYLNCLRTPKSDLVMVVSDEDRPGF